MVGPPAPDAGPHRESMPLLDWDTFWMSADGLNLLSEFLGSFAEASYAKFHMYGYTTIPEFYLANPARSPYASSFYMLSCLWATFSQSGSDTGWRNC